MTDPYRDSQLAGLAVLTAIAAEQRNGYERDRRPRTVPLGVPDQLALLMSETGRHRAPRRGWLDRVLGRP